MKKVINILVLITTIVGISILLLLTSLEIYTNPELTVHSTGKEVDMYAPYLYKIRFVGTILFMITFLMLWAYFDGNENS